MDANKFSVREIYQMYVNYLSEAKKQIAPLKSSNEKRELFLKANPIISLEEFKDVFDSLPELRKNRLERLLSVGFSGIPEFEERVVATHLLSKYSI